MEILLWQPPTIHSVGQVSIEFAGQGELTRITDLYSIKTRDQKYEPGKGCKNHKHRDIDESGK